MAAALSESAPKNYRSRWGLTPADDPSKDFAYRMFVARVLRSPSDCSARGGGGGPPARKIQTQVQCVCEESILPEARRKSAKNHCDFYFVFLQWRGVTEVLVGVGPLKKT